MSCVSSRAYVKAEKVRCDDMLVIIKSIDTGWLVDYTGQGARHEWACTTWGDVLKLLASLSDKVEVVLN